MLQSDHLGSTGIDILCYRIGIIQALEALLKVMPLNCDCSYRQACLEKPPSRLTVKALIAADERGPSAAKQSVIAGLSLNAYIRSWLVVYYQGRNHDPASEAPAQTASLAFRQRSQNENKTPCQSPTA